ncbi:MULTISPECIES: glycosyl transferase [unclassified Microbacterium]|uniref:glycosyl transferase n=1 Tax=unclassified Microbacterium TaxID=2609290 RepID=UPI00300FD2BB
MRFVWAVLAFVLAAVLIGTGIAQRSIFLGPKDVTAELSVDQPQRYTMIDGEVLRSHPGEQTLVAHGDGTIFVAQARTADLEAWLSDVPYNRIALDDAGEPAATVVEPEESTDAAAGSADGRDPAGSDLWLDELTDENAVIDRMQIPDGVSVLLASDGTAEAPADVAVSWPLDNATPWAGPLMVAGGVLALLGLILYILAVRHSRRGKGPRRKGPPPMPPTEPIELARGRTGAIDTGASSDASRAERSAAPRRRVRRAVLVVPAMGLSAALLSGCTPDAWPQFTASPTPTPTPTATPDATQQTPAVTETQAARILENLAATVAEADEKRDATLAATRLSGAALAERETAYTVRGTVADFALPATIPPEKVRILVPQAYDSWPRTTMMLVEHGSDETVPPLILTMTQADPWSNYTVGYVSEMQASAKLPDMAPAWLGAKLTPPDSPFLTVAPDKLGETFADVVDNGEKSAAYDQFDETSLAFVKAVNDSRASVTQDLIDAGAETTSAAAFDAVAGDEEPVAISTIDSGAIVAVTVDDIQSVTPTQEGVDIRTAENSTTAVLAGAATSATGFRTTYSMQLFFAVPAQGSTSPITLLAATQQLLSVEVIP